MRACVRACLRACMPAMSLCFGSGDILLLIAVKCSVVPAFIFLLWERIDVIPFWKLSIFKTLSRHYGCSSVVPNRYSLTANILILSLTSFPHPVPWCSLGLPCGSFCR